MNGRPRSTGIPHLGVRGGSAHTRIHLVEDPLQLVILHGSPLARGTGESSEELYGQGPSRNQ